GRRIVIFSGGGAKSNTEVLAEVQAIAAGGGDGSIMGRNAFQRKKPEALALLSEIIGVYQAVA
ncbi:MAG: fructose-bisphosphate aldolase, partial [Alphaproteobacteria bacterium]